MYATIMHVLAGETFPSNRIEWDLTRNGNSDFPDSSDLSLPILTWVFQPLRAARAAVRLAAKPGANTLSNQFNTT
jgi:hypothetical protein